MPTWVNPDSLAIKFGTDKATANRAGEFRTYGEDRIVEVKLDLTLLSTTNQVQSFQEFIPTGWLLEEVVITTQTAAATGTSALLNLGLCRTDLTSTGGAGTEVDFDGILAAATTAQMTAGNRVTLVKGGTSAGALVGSGSQATANPAYITAATTTGTYTAGVVFVQLKFVKPY